MTINLTIKEILDIYTILNSEQVTKVQLNVSVLYDLALLRKKLETYVDTIKSTIKEDSQLNEILTKVENVEISRLFKKEEFEKGDLPFIFYIVMLKLIKEDSSDMVEPK